MATKEDVAIVGYLLVVGLYLTESGAIPESPVPRRARYDATLFRCATRMRE